MYGIINKPQFNEQILEVGSAITIMVDKGDFPQLPYRQKISALIVKCNPFSLKVAIITSKDFKDNLSKIDIPIKSILNGTLKIEILFTPQSFD